MFAIEYSEMLVESLKELRSFDRRRILDQIDAQLTHQPIAETRNKKMLRGLIPPWEHAEPIWELRVGEFRVFYDVNVDESRVIVRAIRRKSAHKATEDIL